MKNKNLSVVTHRAYGGLPSRAPSTMANPVSRQPDLRWSLSRKSGPRVLHPALNTQPWSTSFAVKREMTAGTRRKARKQVKG